MLHHRCPNPTCLRPFQVNQFSTSLSALPQFDKLTCPHCGSILGGDLGSIYLTHALSEEQENDFNTHHPLDEHERNRD